MSVKSIYFHRCCPCALSDSASHHWWVTENKAAWSPTVASAASCSHASSASHSPFAVNSVARPPVWFISKYKAVHLSRAHTVRGSRHASVQKKISPAESHAWSTRRFSFLSLSTPHFTMQGVNRLMQVVPLNGGRMTLIHLLLPFAKYNVLIVVQLFELNK